MTTFFRIVRLFLFITVNIYTIPSQISIPENISFDHITTENISISTDYSISTCNVLDSNKIDCGFVTMTEDECLYRGCCYQPIDPNPNNLPWCYYTQNHSSTTQIGWIKMISCIEAHSNAQFTYNYNNSMIAYLAQYAVTIKIVPPGGKSNPAYNTYAVMAVPCSNPIYALNNNKELSWVIDMDSNAYDIQSLANYQDNWLGTTAATNRLRNSCRVNSCCPISTARSLTTAIYGAHCVSSNVHILPKQNNPSDAQCEWNYQTSVNQDIEIYFGFDANKIYFCNHTTPNPTYSPTMEPSIEPTINPTMDPTTFQPSINPTTMQPSFYPTQDPTIHPTTFKPSEAPTSNDMRVTDPGTTHTSSDNTQIGKDDIAGDSDDIMTYIIIGVVAGILLICCLLLIYRFNSIKKRKQNTIDNGLNIEKIQSVSGITAITTDNINMGEHIDQEDIQKINNDENDTDKNDGIFTDGILTTKRDHVDIEMQNIPDDSDQDDDEIDLMYDKNTDLMRTKTADGDHVTDGNNENVVNDGDQSDDENEDNNLYGHNPNGQTVKSAGQ